MVTTIYLMKRWKARGDLVVQDHHKGFPASAVGRSVEDLYGLRVPADFGTPLLVLDVAATEHNVRALQGWCEENGFSLAPHVKTTMSPEIIELQLDHGAWAVTVANVTQARTVYACGARRILVANELVDQTSVAWLGERLDVDEAFTGYCYVDSEVGLRLVEEALAARGQRRPLPVIVEFGLPGGRAGLRDPADLLRLADLVGRSRWVRLAGVGAFEGLIAEDLDAVAAFLMVMREAADEVFALGAHGEEFVVTAGGSAYFEIVGEVFDTSWRAGRTIRPVLRSGCYVTHDSVAMHDFRRLMAHRHEPLRLLPALELWARVLSVPEPGRAIVDFGKRDTGSDAGMPVLQCVLRDGVPVPAPEASVVALNDQHAHLVSPGPWLDLTAGDLVCFGVSHPCTTFDKWRLVPVVDTERLVSGAVHTLF